MPTGARVCTTEGVLLPTTAIHIGEAIGQIPKQLADSAPNQLNLIPAPSHSENALVHWLLNLFQ
jgi:hypothetical protein